MGNMCASTRLRHLLRRQQHYAVCTTVSQYDINEAANNETKGAQVSADHNLGKTGFVQKQAIQQCG